MESYFNIRDYMRNQRRERAIAKRCAKANKEAERERIQAALERVRKEAQGCLRSSCETSPARRSPRKAKSPQPSENTSSIHEVQAQASRSFASVLVRKSATNPPPQSPLSEITDVRSLSSHAELNPSILASARGIAIIQMPNESNGTSSSQRPNAAEDDTNCASFSAHRCDEKYALNQPSSKASEAQPRYMDPKRRWELQPLTEALQRFVQAEHVFIEVPPFQYSRSHRATPTSHPLSQHRSSHLISSRQTQSQHSSSAHSIFSLLSQEHIHQLASIGGLHSHRKRNVQNDVVGATPEESIDHKLNADQNPNPIKISHNRSNLCTPTKQSFEQTEESQISTKPVFDTALDDRQRSESPSFFVESNYCNKRDKTLTTNEDLEDERSLSSDESCYSSDEDSIGDHRSLIDRVLKNSFNDCRNATAMSMPSRMKPEYLDIESGATAYIKTMGTSSPSASSEQEYGADNESKEGSLCIEDCDEIESVGRSGDDDGGRSPSVADENISDDEYQSSFYSEDSP